MQTINIAIVDDESNTIELLKRQLKKADRNIVCAGAFSSAEDLFQALKTRDDLDPDVVLMDVGLPGMSGLEATTALRTLHPLVKVLVLTGNENPTLIEQAISAGADGFVVKWRSKDLPQAIEIVASGDAYLSPRITKHLIEKRRVEQKFLTQLFPSLNPRQMQVLDLLRSGMNHKQVAQRLKVSEDAIDWTIKQIRKHWLDTSVAGLLELRKSVV